MTWRDRKITELEAGDVVTIRRRDNARDRVAPSRIISVRQVDGKIEMALNCPKYPSALGDTITHQLEHNREYIYFRWED